MADSDKTVAGTDGSGKTYLVKNFLIPEARKQGNKICIIDVEDEYGDISDARAGKPEQVIKAFRDGHDVVRIVPKARLKPPNMPSNLEHNGKELDKMLRKIVAFQGDLMIVIDEAHNFQTNTKMYSGMLYKILKQGDKYGINVIQASQEPQDYHRNSWNLGGDIIAMPMRDLPSKLKELLPGNLDPRELDRYHYILIPNDPSAPAEVYPPV